MVGAMAYIQRNHLKYWEFSILLCYGYKDLECIMGVGNFGRGKKEAAGSSYSAYL